MKKILISLALLVSLAVSMVAGTLALYQTTIDNVGTSMITAKDFVFVAEGAAGFETAIKMGPGDTRTFNIRIANNDGFHFSEVPMDITFAISFTGDFAGFNHIAISSLVNDTLPAYTAWGVNEKIAVVTITWYKTLAEAAAAGITGLEANESDYNAADTAMRSKSSLLKVSAIATQHV